MSHRISLNFFPKANLFKTSPSKAISNSRCQTSLKFPKFIQHAFEDVKKNIRALNTQKTIDQQDIESYNLIELILKIFFPNGIEGRNQNIINDLNTIKKELDHLLIPSNTNEELLKKSLNNNWQYIALIASLSRLYGLGNCQYQAILNCLQILKYSFGNPKNMKIDVVGMYGQHIKRDMMDGHFYVLVNDEIISDTWATVQLLPTTKSNLTKIRKVAGLSAASVKTKVDFSYETNSSLPLAIHLIQVIDKLIVDVNSKEFLSKIKENLYPIKLDETNLDSAQEFIEGLNIDINKELQKAYWEIPQAQTDLEKIQTIIQKLTKILYAEKRFYQNQIKLFQKIKPIFSFNNNLAQQKYRQQEINHIPSFYIGLEQSFEQEEDSYRPISVLF